MIPVEFFGINGTGPGLADLVRDVVDRVAYTVGKTMSTRKPSLPPPSVVCIKVALEEIW